MIKYKVVNVERDGKSFFADNYNEASLMADAVTIATGELHLVLTYWEEENENR